MSRGEPSTRPDGGVIAIDGPSGAGKSTITRLLAERLGYVHIDTGAMYRAVALAVRRAGVDAADETEVAGICRGLDISFRQCHGGQVVLLNGEDVSAEIRTPEISMLTSAVSALKPVRDILLERQRQMGRHGGVVLEGRDIGTKVFPDADVKFFLTASVEERGRRRYLELLQKGEAVTLEVTTAEVERRDRQDEEREHAPLRRADDAVVIDCSNLSIDQVLDVMENNIKAKIGSWL